MLRLKSKSPERASNKKIIVPQTHAKDKIRINAVSPGNVYFKGSIWEKKFLEDPKKIEKMLNTKIPLKKFVTLDDISEAVAFLSSPLSCSTTGQILDVDAGQSIL